MKIIGVGAGPGLLTEEAINAIEHANIVFGSRRAIELAKDHIRCEAREIEDYTLDSLPRSAVVLSTGDPMLSGLGKFAKEGDAVIAGISSLQLACSRLRLDIDSLAVVTAHSRDADSVRDKLTVELGNGKDVFLLPGPSFGVSELAVFLGSLGMQRQITVCERLAYPDERISTGTTERPPAAASPLHCIVIRN